MSANLVTLWDLMQLAQVSELMDEFAGIIALGKHFESMHERGIRPAPTAEQVALQVRRAERLHELLVGLDLKVSAQFAADIVIATKSITKDENGKYPVVGQALSTIIGGAGRLADVLPIEMQATRFYAFTASQWEFFSPSSPLWGEEFANKFPGALYDLDEGGKCLAFGRSTAAAFHFIRCLEAGVRAMCRSLGIPDPTKGSQRNWTFILQGINDELDKRWPRNTRLGGDSALFERVVGTLTAMQNPYRNATMHLDQTYTPEQARLIMEMVGGVMRLIASRMDESGDPKA